MQTKTNQFICHCLAQYSAGKINLLYFGYHVIILPLSLCEDFVCNSEQGCCFIHSLLPHSCWCHCCCFKYALLPCKQTQIVLNMILTKHNHCVLILENWSIVATSSSEMHIRGSYCCFVSHVNTHPVGTLSLI